MHDFPLLKALADGRFKSGEELATTIGLSRSGVWKAVQRLEKLGLDIHAVRGKGYRLADPIELLDVAAIESVLASVSRAALGEIEILPVVDSTNRYLLKQAYSHTPPKAVFAESQTAGRGRRGRNWVSPFGANLYLSLSWRFATGVGALEGLSLACGVAIVKALRELGISEAGVKWPNDIYWRDRKLGGILIEMTGESTGPCNTVIGVGLNTKMPHGKGLEIEQSWVDINTILGSNAPSRTQLAGVVLGSLLQALQEFTLDGFAPFRGQWHQFDITAGRPVAVLGLDKHTSGKGCGIDSAGAFLLETERGVERYLSGDISLRLT